MEDGQEIAGRFAAQLGVETPTVRVLSMKKQWASCGRDNVIRLDPALVQLPRAIFEYVVAHEVAHLIYRNHSVRFWRVVRRLVPEYIACRSALDEHDQRSRR
jgi:predicted metal-dependent hydrolase